MKNQKQYQTMQDNEDVCVDGVRKTYRQDTNLREEQSWDKRKQNILRFPPVVPPTPSIAPHASTSPVVAAPMVTVRAPYTAQRLFLLLLAPHKYVELFELNCISASFPQI